METDAAFFEIFKSNPSRFQELTELALPRFKAARAPVLKTTLQATCDLLFEPSRKDDPYWIAELQMYFDHSIFNRTDLARALVWKDLNEGSDCLRKGYQPRKVRGVVIFGDRTLLPPNLARHPGIEYLFLDELIEKLRERNPDSPLLAVLAPLIMGNNQLESQAANYYDSIKDNPNLTDHERQVLSDVFVHFISQRFKNLNSQDIRKMIAQLTPFEETALGKELIEIVREKAMEKVASKMILTGKSDQEIADLTELPLKTIQELRVKLG